MLRTIRQSILSGTVALLALGGGLACAPSGNAPSGIEASIPDDVADWHASGAVAAYDTESIFDYIDGHAEVYLAYGMKRSLARRYTGPDGEADIVLDLFELASSDDAFGVFTHDLDGVPVGIGNNSRLRYGWLSFWQGPWFVSVSSEMESDRASQAVLELGRAISGGLPREGAPPVIIDALPPFGLDVKSLRFLRHPQILNTHIWVDDENLLGLGPDTSAALGTYRRDDQEAHLLLIDYRSGGAAEKAREAFAGRFLTSSAGDETVEVEDRGWYGVAREGSRLIAVLGADSREIADALLAEMMGNSQ